MTPVGTRCARPCNELGNDDPAIEAASNTLPSRGTLTQKMPPESAKDPSFRLEETLMALAITFICYPLLVAGTGFFSNGGPYGFGFLVAACWYAWRAFVLNTKSSWLRRVVQMPLVIVVTYQAIHDGIVLLVVGWGWKH